MVQETNCHQVIHTASNVRMIVYRDELWRVGNEEQLAYLKVKLCIFVEGLSEGTQSSRCLGRKFEFHQNGGKKSFEVLTAVSMNYTYW